MNNLLPANKEAAAMTAKSEDNPVNCLRAFRVRCSPQEASASRLNMPRVSRLNALKVRGHFALPQTVAHAPARERK
jgi:hypothetical protein